MERLNPAILRSVGIDPKEIEKSTIVEKLEDLLDSPPYMVLAQVFVNCDMLFDNRIRFPLRKGSVIVIPLDAFLNSKRDSVTRKIHLKPYRKFFSEYFRRYRGQNLENKTLLIWRWGGLGDLLFIQPIVKYLKEKYPTCKIVLASAVQNRDLLELWPKGLIDTITDMPFKKEFLTEADYHLSFEGTIERCKESHFINSYDVFSKFANIPVDLTNDKYQIELISDKKTEQEVTPFVPENTIILQIRATSPIRMMELSKWKIIIDGILDLGFNVGFLDDAVYSNIYDNLFVEYNLDRSRVFNLSLQSKDIKHAISILNLSAGVVGVDSAFIHIAAALKKPVVGIYGPFLGETRMKYYKNASWVEPKETECPLFPCFFHHFQTNNCPFVRSRQPVKCLQAISESSVLDKIKELFVVQKSVKEREINDEQSTNQLYEAPVLRNSNV
jgi:ADP-heptose:LPS heptosyltransferase